MSRHKILFVDDEQNILRTLKRLFIDSDYEIFTASSGIEAIGLLDKENFSLILSDYRMPEMNGVEFLMIAKEKTPDTIRMILTGFADVSVAISAINEGEIYKFCEKPWEGESLKVQVKRAIEHHELVSERKELLERIKVQNEELKDLNQNLEQKVDDKTHELKKAYKDLQLKVKELEGRDTILQYLLTIHTFDEIINLILEVLGSLNLYDKILIYVTDTDKNKMVPKAGITVEEGESLFLKDEIGHFPELPVLKIAKDDRSILEGTSPLNKINEHSIYLPIEKDRKCLGALLVDNSQSKKKLELTELKTLSGFTSLAALAINEQVVSDSLPDIHSQIDDFLGELS